MKFRIISSSYCLDIETEILLDDYPVLKNYGLEVTKETKSGNSTKRILDENGNPITQEKTYKYDVKKAYVTIDTLEQLMNFIRDVNYPVIVTEDAIEIYDGYRE